MTVDKARLANKSGELNRSKMAEIDEATKATLGL